MFYEHLSCGGKRMLRMDEVNEVNKIKKAYRNGASINEIAVQYCRSWETVRVWQERCGISRIYLFDIVR